MSFVCSAVRDSINQYLCSGMDDNTPLNWKCSTTDNSFACVQNDLQTHALDPQFTLGSKVALAMQDALGWRYIGDPVYSSNWGDQSVIGQLNEVTVKNAEIFPESLASPVGTTSSSFTDSFVKYFGFSSEATSQHFSYGYPVAGKKQAEGSWNPALNSPVGEKDGRRFSHGYPVIDSKSKAKTSWDASLASPVGERNGQTFSLGYPSVPPDRTLFSRFDEPVNNDIGHSGNIFDSILNVFGIKTVDRPFSYGYPVPSVHSGDYKNEPFETFSDTPFGNQDLGNSFDTYKPSESPHKK